MAGTKRKIRGGQVTSIKSLKSQLKKGGGGAGFFTRIPSEGSLTVRFMTEPDGWVMFYEHYDQERKFYPCADDCPGCAEGDRPSQRYLVNAIDQDENKVIPLVLPKTLASNVLKKYDKWATVTDRDYELSRTGDGRDTEYDVIPETPTRINLNRYEELDLWSLVEGQLQDEDDEDDEDEEERPVKKKRPAPPRSGPKRRAAVDDDDEDDDDEDDDDDDEMPPRRPVKKAAKKPLKKKRSLSRK